MSYDQWKQGKFLLSRNTVETKKLIRPLFHHSLQFTPTRVGRLKPKHITGFYQKYGYFFFLKHIYPEQEAKAEVDIKSERKKFRCGRFVLRSMKDVDVTSIYK